MGHSEAVNSPVTVHAVLSMARAGVCAGCPSSLIECGGGPAHGNSPSDCQPSDIIMLCPCIQPLSHLLTATACPTLFPEGPWPCPAKYPGCPRLLHSMTQKEGPWFPQQPGSHRTFSFQEPSCCWYPWHSSRQLATATAAWPPYTSDSLTGQGCTAQES